MLFSLYSKKLNKYGAIASIAVGAATTIVWKYGLVYLSDFFEQVYEIIPGFLLATAALFLVSYLTRKRVSEEDRAAMDEEFNTMMNILHEEKESDTVCEDTNEQ